MDAQNKSILDQIQRYAFFSLLKRFKNGKLRRVHRGNQRAHVGGKQLDRYRHQDNTKELLQDVGAALPE